MRDSMHVRVYAAYKHSQQKGEMLPRQILDTTGGHMVIDIDSQFQQNCPKFTSLQEWGGGGGKGVT